jgi:hypothetical protein
MSMYGAHVALYGTHVHVRRSCTRHGKRKEKKRKDKTREERDQGKK